MWDVQTGKHLKTLSGHTHDIYIAMVSPHGEMIASAGADKTVRLWHAGTGRSKATLNGHTQSVLSLVFSHDEDTLVSWNHAEIYVWNTREGKLNTTIKGYEKIDTSTIYFPLQETVAVWKKRKNIALWNTHTAKQLATYTADEVLFSSDGETLVYERWLEPINLVDTKTGQIRVPVSLRSGSIGPHVFSPDCNTLISVTSWNNQILTWNVNTGRTEKTLMSPTRHINAIVLSPDKKTLAIADSWHNQDFTMGFKHRRNAKNL